MQGNLAAIAELGNYETRERRERGQRVEACYRAREKPVIADRSNLVQGRELSNYRRVFRGVPKKGSGFLEAVYQECLAIELAEQGIPFEEKPRLRLTYKGRLIKHEYVPDFLCFGKIIVEIKSVKILTDEHRAQVINYLKATGKQLGLLVNFGHYPKIERERFVNQSLSRISRVS